jgi:two-component system, OmpR family, response regulator
MKTILIVEDDRDIRTLLADFLAREGFSVVAAEDGEAAERALARLRPDLIILDLMLPGEDGLSICRRLRARGSAPILMLTAKNDEVDRIVGLELGADDYMGKPFNPRELLARIRAVLRRCEPASTAPPAPGRRCIAFGGFRADLDGRRVMTADGRPVALTSAEFDLLACLVARPGRVLSRDQLLDWTRGRSAEPFDRTIDVTVSRLRKKLEAVDPAAGGLVTTVRNGGYLFAAQVAPVETMPWSEAAVAASAEG